MAVVQISKIQIRRGKKNSTTGVPQLSSGELAWAVDTQELFIGNGSVAEGAPAVGNSKVLTEHDNLLDFLETYKYGGPAFTPSVPRTFQSKLDDRISIYDFGPSNMGAGIIDCTPYFQAALSGLFGGTNTSHRKQLFIPSGHYKIAGDLYVPSNTVMVGENPTESVIMIGTNAARSNIFFESSDGHRPGTFFSGGQLPINVYINNLTFDTTHGQVDITGLNGSSFYGVNFTGGYTSLGDEITNPAIVATNTVFGTRVDDIEFSDCHFSNVDVAFKLTQAEVFDTKFKFVECEFDMCGRGLWIVGVVNQGNRWDIIDTSFTDIATEAFYSTQGVGTVIHGCHFVRCGNGNNNDLIPYTPVVRFGQNGDNVANLCTFSRTQALLDAIDFTTPAMAEVENGSATISNRLKKTIQLGTHPLAIFSSSISQLQLEYVLTLSGTVRTGIVNITVDKTNELAVIKDEYGYTANATRMEGFDITSGFLDNDADPGAVKETFMLYYTNPIGNNATGSINFTVKYSV